LPFALISLAWLPCALAACSGRAPSPKATTRNVVLITIDTLRADHVGAYGYSRARTPAIDRLAADGALFERGYAAAPITLPSHATILTGRYPPGHGARDNGMRMADGVATLATVLHARGFRTAAFIAAFPLDHQFGLNRGFDVYSDRLPRAPNGRLSNERPAADVVNDAIAWLRSNGISPSEPVAVPQSPIRSPQFFLWVHLFDPHAPYGDPATGRSAIDRYDEEIATADREIGRLLEAIAARRNETLVVLAGDHGEAFGEHGEYAHSIFVYDTTLRVPLVMSGPGIAANVRVGAPVTLADVAPTILRHIDSEVRLKTGSAATDLGDVDGIDLAPAFGGGALPRRELYAESFAPLIEFGWAPLRAIRADSWKLIAAPKPELFDVEHDPAEQSNRIADDAATARRLADRANRYSSPDMPTTTGIDREAAQRLRALGYSSGSSSASAPGIRNPQSAMPGSTTSRADPKDRRELAARIAQVTSGELTGAALVAALEGIVRDDPRNGQAHLRLAYARLASGDCARAEPEFQAAASTGLPSADIYLGLATCLGRRNDLGGAERALNEAQRLEPDNPAVIANVGIVRAAKGDHPGAIQALRSALAIDPDLHEARFNLALEYARSGRRADAAAAARDLLARLPPDAPQRPEVDRLLRAVQ
jgi:arylsulfatase A-like enzyme/cytochrome c-type biogenesis protein CcmH/NrfG